SSDGEEPMKPHESVIPRAVARGTLVLIVAAASLGGDTPAARADTSKPVDHRSSLAQIYAYLQVEPPAMSVLPARRHVQCEPHWVSWDPASAPAAHRLCLARWHAERSLQCRSETRCGCERHA